MYNKLSSSYNKKHIYNFEDEPPEKKLVSDADLFIKHLAEKQRNTKTTLDEQLSSRREFYKSTELVPLTNYTSGSASLEEFTSVVKRSDEIEKLKAYGLTNDDMDLFFDYQQGKKHFQNKHKNMNQTILEDRLKNIFEIIHKATENVEKKFGNCGRLKTELVLSAKPTSLETKLLKFALENQQKSTDKLPHPMDTIKDIETLFTDDLSNIDIKKIRRKARSLGKQIDSIESREIKEPQKINKNSLFYENSQWDVREPQTEGKTEKKVYSCKPQNYYTIKNGEIIKINSPDVKKKYSGEKLSTEEIKKNPKFENYSAGVPSKMLYLKNLANGINESDLRDVFNEFSHETVESVKIMKGKMRGQAFVETESEKVAENILNQCNGILLNDKPVIIQFSKTSNST